MKIVPLAIKFAALRFAASSLGLLAVFGAPLFGQKAPGAFGSLAVMTAIAS